MDCCINDLNASIKVRATDLNENEELETKLIETTVGRVLFNEVVPEKAGYINEVLTKKSLRDIIGRILKLTSVPETADFLDKIKEMGFTFAFKGGLSFSLGDIIIPAEKDKMIDSANQEVDSIISNYNMGLITNNERYNQVIDVWTSSNASLTELAMKRISEDQQGFNSVFMMLDSGARGSKEQIRQLTGMRGLMAKPKKASSGGGEIIENPILSNFKEGLSILEYFISTHGARKGLADTALKTADAGYLTRRLVDVSQDVIITEDDCGTLRGINVSALKKNEEVVEKLGDRIVGRTSLQDVYDPITGELLVKSYNQIFDLPYTIIRPSALYGERCVSRRVGQIFIENAIQGLDININGDGKEKLDFTYIEDLIAGIGLCCEKENAKNQIFNLTYGNSRKISELTEILKQEFPDIKIFYKDKEKFMPERGTLDVSKAKKLLGYKPVNTIETGYVKYISWYKKFWNNLK